MESPQHIQQSQADHDLLVRIDERTTSLSKDFVEFRNSLVPQFTDYESRIRTLEKSKWTWAGGITVISTSMGWLINVLFK